MKYHSFRAKPYNTVVIALIEPTITKANEDNKYKDTIQEALDIPSPFGYAFCAIDNVVVLKLQDITNVEAVVHECVHAYMTVCRINGVQLDPFNQEPTAYGISEIFKSITKETT